MSLRLRALRLTAETEDGEYGRELSFGDGLVVLRAENSMGKTTAANSILYALGMEGLIAQSHDVPLTAAMTDQLEAPDGRRLNVAESRVLLEVENGLGHTATLERYAKRANGDTRTIRVWNSRRVTEPGPGDDYRDMLARVRGSGTGELAIGRWLEEFVGWDLPTIVMPDGGERRLYPELLLSLVFVEQRAGWRGIQAAMPTYGIPDARKRAREYMLGLDIYAQERKRLELGRKGKEIDREWAAAFNLADAHLRSLSVRVVDIPRSVDSSFNDLSPLRVVALQNGRALDNEQSEVAKELAALAPVADTKRDPATISADDKRLQELETVLQTAQLDARARQRDLAQVFRKRQELDEQRLRLTEDLRRNQDAHRLHSLGGEPWAMDDRDCPTCHQHLPATLIGTLDRPTMTVEQNVAYVKQQLEVVDGARARAETELDAKSQVQAAAQRGIAEVRREIRALRDALVRARGVPSAADVQRRLTLERRSEELASAETEVGALRGEFASLAERARSNNAALAALPRAGLTKRDRETLDVFERSFLEQLRLYNPESLPVHELGISRESYVPAAGDVDLAFQISASDGIRLLWAYLLGMLETARTETTNHPGFVVFDEPRQQSARDESLRMLLRRASDARRFHQQVLFATSEPPARLEPMLKDLDVQYVPIEGRMLVPQS